MCAGCVGGDDEIFHVEILTQLLQYDYHQVILFSHCLKSLWYWNIYQLQTSVGDDESV